MKILRLISLSLIACIGAYAQASGVGATTGSGNGVLQTSPALLGTPSAPTQTAGDASTAIATDAFVVAAIAAQVDMHAAVLAATTTALTFSPTYSNGSSGVGATLTATTFGVLVLDGYTPVLGDRLLIKNQASTFQNGCYTVTTLGVVATTDYVLTRCTDANQTSNILYGNTYPVLQGTTNANQQFTMNNNAAITVGTTAITYTQTSGGSQLSASLPIVITGNALSAPSAVTASSPGVGLCHFAGSTQACTSSAVNLASADVTGALPFSGLAATAHNLIVVYQAADTSGSGTAQSANTSPSFTPAANDCVWYTTTTTNSGTGLTININSLGNKSVAIPGASGWTTTLTASIIPANKPLLACYDGTNWNVQQTGTAASGGGVAVQVNGSATGLGTTANFNGTTPSAAAGYQNVTWQVSGTSISAEVPTTIKTQSSAVTGNISATSMLASAGASDGYQMNWEVSLTAAGTSCTGSTTVVLNKIFTDPNTSSAQTVAVGTITIASSGVGTVGYVADGVETIYAKTGTAIQFSTTSYTLGAACTSTNPTYQVTTWLSTLHGAF